MTESVNKVAMLVPNLGGGGAERMAAYVSNGLARHGFDVEIVLFSESGVGWNFAVLESHAFGLNNRFAVKSIAMVDDVWQKQSAMNCF